MAEFTRFFNDFKPENYQVYLDINRQDKKFSGSVTVKGEALNHTIRLHQKGLIVTSVTVNNHVVDFVINDTLDAIEINVSELGEVVVEVKYHALLTDTMMGIYPSYYEVDGVKKQIIGTQFETNFARQAFPCVDEPEAKATFDLSLKFDEQPGETVLANMPEKRVAQGIHYFDTTVRMSTYLVAFAFGELQDKQTKTKSGVNIGVYATKAHEAKTLDFALDIAKRSIEFFEEFYQTPYPLPQSNQLALPDFSAGAMENWGLVTYREAYLVLDPDNTALDTKKVVATVIAHELAHQWFGDLVTMKWWDDLWLNESFANMMEYVAIDALEPDWHIWEAFQTTDVPAALRRDATDGVQSVHVQVNHPDEIDALFDGAIVYAKGARLLVMVRSLIGDEALRLGLKNYFAAHQYDNATGDDLWHALGEASGKDVAAIMTSWLEQPGYPIIDASVVDGEIVLEQSQFFIGEGENIGRQWQIPLNIAGDNMPELMSEKTMTVGNYVTYKQQNKQPFQLNVGNTTHAVVHYDETLLQDILMNIGTLDTITQLQLLQDWYLLAESNQLSYADVIALIKPFSDSQSSIVNNALYHLANGLKRFVTPDSLAEKHLKQLYADLSDKQFDRLGWTSTQDDSLENELTRPYIISAALYAENQNAIKQGHLEYRAHEANLASLSADTRLYVLKNEIQNYGDSALIKKLFSEYVSSSDASYKSNLRSAITSAKNERELKVVLSEFKHAGVIKPQDLRGWFAGVLNNDFGEQLAWNWIRDNWEWLEEKVGGDMEFTTYITVIANVFRTQQRLNEFEAFFNPKLDQPALTREIVMDKKVIASRVALIMAEKEKVEKKLAV